MGGRAGRAGGRIAGRAGVVGLQGWAAEGDQPGGQLRRMPAGAGHVLRAPRLCRFRADNSLRACDYTMHGVQTVKGEPTTPAVDWQG